MEPSKRTMTQRKFIDGFVQELSRHRPNDRVFTNAAHWLNKQIDAFIKDADRLSKQGISLEEAIFEFKVPRRLLRKYRNDKTYAELELKRIIDGLFTARGINTEQITAIVGRPVGSPSSISLQISARV